MGPVEVLLDGDVASFLMQAVIDESPITRKTVTPAFTSGVFGDEIH